LATLPLVWHVPLIRQARSYGGSFWAKAQWMNIPDFYTNMFFPTILILISLVLISAIHKALFQNTVLDESVPAVKAEPPIYELVAAAGYIVVPIICVGLGIFVTGGFTDRYAIIAIIGSSILVSFAAAKLNNDNVFVSVVLVVAFLGGFRLLIARDTWYEGRNTRAEMKIQLLQQKD
jgi:hypothetical protein